MAARPRHTKVCILNCSEVDLLNADVPLNHRSHPHISKTKADELTGSLLYVDENKRRFYEAYYVLKGKRAIVFNEARSWQLTPGALGVWGWQLLPGGGIR